MTQSSREIVRGLKAFAKFLQTERSRFAASPILLITSHADVSKPGRTSPQMADAVRHVNFVLQQQLGFRTVLTHPVSNYSFPTVADVTVLVDLAARVGASTVAAVGSGVAIDLAKAFVSCQEANNALDELVLIPSSYGAAMAATSTHALLLDPIEEALIVQQQPAAHQQQNPATILLSQRHLSTTIVTLEPNLFRTASREESLLAAVALALDHVYQNGTASEAIESLLERAVQCLLQQQQQQTEESAEQQHDVVAEIMYATGASISYGLGSEENRSIPLALAASLIPNSFPQYSITAFLASLVPAYCHALLERQGQGQCSLELVRSISALAAPTMVTNESFPTLLSHIYANQALWNCLDCSSADFRTILRNHLLV